MNIKLQKRHSNILKQIHKLKSENRTLSDRRKYAEWYLLTKNDCPINALFIFDGISRCSEHIGRNSLKIMQLRTKISQEKAQFEREELLLQEQWLMNDSQDMLDAQNEIFIDKGGS